MLGNLFAPKPTFVFAQLNIRVMPEQRGEWFEDPLDEALKAEKLGEVTGGGTLQEKSGEIAWVGLDLELLDLTRSIPLVTEFLTRRGAPKGSRLEYKLRGSRMDLPFGAVEGMGVYLNGTDLPPEVYRDCGADQALDGLSLALGDLGAYANNWQGPAETALYFYGESFAAMRDAAQPFLASYPLCQHARVVQIA